MFKSVARGSLHRSQTCYEIGRFKPNVTEQQCMGMGVIDDCKSIGGDGK